MMVVLYNSHLGSFLIYYQDQENYEIICEENSYNFFLNLKPEAKYKVRWKNLDFISYNNEIERLEYAQKGYCLISEIWDVYKHFQKNLLEKRFKVFDSWETSSNFPITLYLRRPFQSLLEPLFLYTYSGGLFDFWNERFWLKKWIHHTTNEDQIEQSFQLKCVEIEFALRCLEIGLFGSIIVFCGEILKNYIKRRSNLEHIENALIFRKRSFVDLTEF